MKKYLFMFIFTLFCVFCFSFSYIEAKTVSTDLGDINFDLEQIIEDNSTLNLSNNYIIAKRTNNDVCLYIFHNNTTPFLLNYNPNNTNYNPPLVTLGLYALGYNIPRFIYNFNTNTFEYISEGVWSSTNTIYDSSFDDLYFRDTNNSINKVSLVSSNNYYSYDFANKILLYNSPFYEDTQDLVPTDFYNIDFSNNSSYTTELVNYNSNRLSNINSFNTDSTNLIKGNTWQQYGQYYFSVGYRNYFSDSPDFVRIGRYYNKQSNQYEYSFIIDVSKTVYFYNTLNSNFRFKLMSTTNTPGWSVPRFFGSLITDINSTDNTGFFTNLPEIKLLDNVSLQLYDKYFSFGDTVFHTENDIVYLADYSSTPTVDFTSSYTTDENDFNISITVNSIFSTFDPARYKYYYQTNNDSDWIILAYNQQMIDTRTFTKTFYDNGYLSIKIANMNDETLATYTYNWDQIDITNGFVENFGNNSFGINSRNITLSSGLTSTTKIFNNITCESERPFENDTCFVKYADLLPNISNYLDTKISTQVYFSNNYNSIPLDGNKYYLLNYRVYSDFLLIPDVLVLRSDDVTFSTQIINTDVKEHGIYKDYIITFQVSAAPNDTVAITGFHLIFPNLKDVTDTITEYFQLGIYKSFKIQQYDNKPTQTELNNFYDNNSLDSISSGNSTDFFNNFTINDHGVSQIIRKPLEILSYINSSVCTPIEIPFPNTEQKIVLPCLQSLLADKLGILFTIIQTIFAGIICYRVGLGVFSTIKGLVNPKNDKVEVIDL